MSQPLIQSSLAKASPWTGRIQFWLLSRALGCPCLQLLPCDFPGPETDPGFRRLLAPKWHPRTPPVSVWDLPPPSQRLSCHCPRVESTGSWIRGMRMCKAGRESLRKLLYIAMLPGACSPRKAQVQTPKAPPWVVHQGLLTLESPCSLSAAQQTAIEQ